MHPDDDLRDWREWIEEKRRKGASAAAEGSREEWQGEDVDIGAFDVRALLAYLPRLEDLVLDVRLVLTPALHSPTPLGLLVPSAPILTSKDDLPSSGRHCRRIGLRGSAISNILDIFRSPLQLSQTPNRNVAIDISKDLDALSLVLDVLPQSLPSHCSEVHFLHPDTIPLESNRPSPLAYTCNLVSGNKSQEEERGMVEEKVRGWIEHCKEKGVALRVPGA